MKEAPAVLFLQKRSHRAGAQTSLTRLLGSRTLENIRPVALLGEEGWLAEELRKQGVMTLVVPFPSPRALKSRLFGIRFFARKVKGELAAAGIRVVAAVGNDHQECPLVLAVSRKVGRVPTLAFFRSAAMTERDFLKYDCGTCDACLCVGEALGERVRGWSGKEPVLFREGFHMKEFSPAGRSTDVFPERILIAGTEQRAKGFGDFIEALDLVEAEHPDFPALECDFTAATFVDRAMLEKRRRARFNFLGRIDDFPVGVRNYGLMVHPSRAETFGMAPVEAVLAGVPVLVSATGIAAETDEFGAWRFLPENPRALAEKLVEIWRTWPDPYGGLKEIQEALRERFCINKTAVPLRDALARCGVD